MRAAKGHWVRPELVVLVRNRVEEAVLAACKVYPNPIMGPSTTVTRCGVAGCGPCNDWVSSAS